tara:strand:+ start:2088 stop:2378 length:291 start_codon:yes stop_codon:yes gene_type:complete
MKSKLTCPVYEAQVGALGKVTFYKEPKSATYCFVYFNGMDYTPLILSEEAAYFTWIFIGREHPEANFSTFTPPKKAGRGKHKKRPSKPIKKKVKSK